MVIPLLLLFLDSVQGLVNPTTTPTSQAQHVVGLGQGFTPKTTQAPLIKANWLGAVSKRDLFPRQVDDANAYTCGWYDGDPASAIVCNPNSLCATFTDALPYYFACCPATSGSIYETACPYRGACLPYGDGSNPNTASDYYVFDSTVLCGAGAPSCYTVVNYDASGTTWYYEGCGTVSATYTAFMYTTTTNTRTVNPVSGQSSTGSSASSSLSQPIHSGQGTRTSSSSSSPTGTGGNGENKHSTNVGAIAGGTVGGVAAIAIVGAVIGYLMYKKRKDRVAPMAEVSQYGGSTMQGGSQYGGSQFASPKPQYSGVSQGGGYGQGAPYDQGGYSGGYSAQQAGGYGQGGGYGQPGHYSQQY